MARAATAFLLVFGVLSPSGSAAELPTEVRHVKHTIDPRYQRVSGHSSQMFMANEDAENADLVGLSVVSPGCRVYDSSIEGDPILPGTGVPKLVQVAGNCGVPLGASAVVVTVTSKLASGVGNLRVSSAGVLPEGGVLNYITNGLDQSNTVTVPLSAGGALDVAANNGDSHVRVVVVGYYSQSGTLLYNGVTPCAVADSRTNATSFPSGGFVGSFAAGSAMPDVDVAGTFNVVGDNQGGGQTDCGVPDGVFGVVANIVSIGGTGTGGVAAGAGGTSPTEPTVNYAPIGLNNAAVAYLPVDASGKIAVDVLGTGTTHIRIVVLGYLTTTGDSYSPVNPCSAFDSRDTLAVDPDNVPSGMFAGKRIAGTATTYNVTGTIPAGQGGANDCAVPDGASAVSINLVAIQPDAAGNFRAYATGSAPTGGVLNFSVLAPPVNNANTVVVPLSTAGDMDLFTNAPSNEPNPTVHARGVILGYYMSNTVPTLDLDADDSGLNSPNFVATFSVLNPSPLAVADSDVNITDATDVNMESASVTLANAADGASEQLAVDEITSCAGLTVGGAGTGSLVLMGSAPIAIYEGCLASATYVNTAPSPTLAPVRVIEFVVNDGAVDSAARTATVTVVPAILLNYNFIFVIDTSGSMGNDISPDVPGDRLEAVQQALTKNGGVFDRIETNTADFVIQVIEFNSSAGEPRAFASIADAKSYVNGLAAGGTSNFNDAVEVTLDQINADAVNPTLADFIDVVYFLSEGDPFPDSAATSQSNLDQWQTALVNENIDAVMVDIASPDGDNPTLEELANPQDDPSVLNLHADLSNIDEILFFEFD